MHCLLSCAQDTASCVHFLPPLCPVLVHHSTPLIKDQFDQNFELLVAELIQNIKPIHENLLISFNYTQIASANISCKFLLVYFSTTFTALP